MVPRRSSMLGVAIAVGGCTGVAGDGASDGAGPRAEIVGSIDPAPYCNDPDIVEIVMRAAHVGCEGLPAADCEPSGDRVDGDRLSCPVTDPSAFIGVSVGAAGRYAVEVVGILTTRDEQGAVCFAAAGASPPVLVTAVDIDAGAHIMVDATSGPCP